MATVLLIDGVAEVLGMVTAYLGAQGHEVIEATDARAGLVRFAEGGIDLIVTDLFMPEMDGLELIRAIRRRDAKVPIVAVSDAVRGNFGCGLLATAVAFGATRTLAVPASQERLSNEFDRLLHEAA